jgi:hypothetical protein
MVPVSQHPDKDPPVRRSRLIRSDSSILDRAVVGLLGGGNDVKTRTRAGPIFATTRHPTTRRVTT